MRYEVVIPWFGVSVGDVVETEKLHPALLPNVRELKEVAKPQVLEVATPEAVATKRGRKPKSETAEAGDE